MQKEEAHNLPSLCPLAQISIIKNRLRDNEAGWHTCSWRSYFKDDPLCARICSLSHYDQQTVKAADYRRASEPSRRGEASFVIELLPPWRWHEPGARRSRRCLSNTAGGWFTSCLCSCDLELLKSCHIHSSWILKATENWLKKYICKKQWVQLWWAQH